MTIFDCNFAAVNVTDNIMSYETLDALREIDNMVPMYRQDYIMEFVKKNLPKADAKSILLHKDKTGYLNRMAEEGFVNGEDLLKTIGKERIEEFLRSSEKMS